MSQVFEGLFKAKLRDNGTDFSEDDYKRFCLQIRAKFSNGVLDLKGQRIGINVLTKLTKVLRSNPHIRVFNFYGNLIRDHGIHSLLQLLLSNPQVKVLDIGCNDLTNQSAQTIFDIIRSTAIVSLQLGITEVAWNNNKFSIETIESIISSVKTAKRIQYFGLSRLPLSVRIGSRHFSVADQFSSFIANDKTLLSLSLSGCGLSQKEMSSVVLEGFLHNSTLKFIDVHDSILKEPLGSLFLRDVHKMSNLTYLDLRQCHLSSEAGAAFLESLRQTKSLTVINLGDNEIGDAGFASIIEGLMNNETVTELFIPGNRITEASADGIRNILIHSKTLFTLDLSRNSLGDEGAQAIADGLLKNMDLSNLSIGSCRITDKGAIIIAQNVAMNKGLRSLDFSDNFFSKDCGYHLLELFQKNEILLSIDGSSSQIDHFAIAALSDICKRNRQIQREIELQPLKKELIQLSIQRTKMPEAVARLKGVVSKRDDIQKGVIKASSDIESMISSSESQLRFLKKSIDGTSEALKTEEKSFISLQADREKMLSDYSRRYEEIEKNTKYEEGLLGIAETKGSEAEVEIKASEEKEAAEKKQMEEEIEKLKARFEELRHIAEDRQAVKEFVTPADYVKEETPHVFLAEKVDEFKAEEEKKKKKRKKAKKDEAVSKVATSARRK